MTAADLMDMVRELRSLITERAEKIRRRIGGEHEEIAAELDAFFAAAADHLGDIVKGE